MNLRQVQVGALSAVPSLASQAADATPRPELPSSVQTQSDRESSILRSETAASEKGHCTETQATATAKESVPHEMVPNAQSTTMQSDPVSSFEAGDAGAASGRNGLAREEKHLSLIDSPLIGAPFRLAAFFTDYVSGADLLPPKPPGDGILARAASSNDLL